MKAIECPHGQVFYEGFAWHHVDTKTLCKSMNGTHYTKIAAAFHKRLQSGDQDQNVEAALARPDLPWLVTPQGMFAVARWLCARSVHDQAMRLGTLIICPAVSVMYRVLRREVENFEGNVQHMQWRLSVSVVPDLTRDSTKGQGPQCGVIMAGDKRGLAMADLSISGQPAEVTRAIEAIGEAWRATQDKIDKATR